MPAREGARLTVFGLVVDSVTVEVTRALREAGVRSLLMKGPLLAELYRGEARPYADTDLLVAPGSAAASAGVLGSLGFHQSERDKDFPKPLAGHAWRRPDGSVVDLHRSLPLVSADPAEVWTAVSEGSVSTTLGGVEVETVGPDATALLAALHPLHHGMEEWKPIRDLQAALDHLPGPDWEAAARLAARLGALPALAAGLRLVPEGAILADELSLPTEITPELALLAGGENPVALGLDRLAGAPGARARAGLLARALLPTPAAMRNWHALARRGRPGLAAAYLLRPAWLATQAPAALSAWRAARRRAGSSRRP